MGAWRPLGGGNNPRSEILAASIKKVTLGNGEKWTDPRGTFNTKVWTHGRSSQKWKKWKKKKICPGLYVEMIELITYFIAEDLCDVVADFQDCLYMEDSRARRHYIFYNNPVETPIT